MLTFLLTVWLPEMVGLIVLGDVQPVSTVVVVVVIFSFSSASFSFFFSFFFLFSFLLFFFLCWVSDLLLSFGRPLSRLLCLPDYS